MLSVSQLTGDIKDALEAEFGEVWITGEVSNLRVQASGHRYFSLKDEGAQIACVLFRGQSGINRELVEDGRKLILRGDLSVYEPQGRYQIIVREVELEGIGELQRRFEALKKKLQAEGLFEQDRKRPQPEFIQRIGLVTSPSGAAIRDVLHVISRRFRGLEIVLVPVRVQGSLAAPEISNAIALLNEYHAKETTKGGPGLDLILATRGGGSLEDLWPFNEEIVARAIHASELPVVSAVGHEIDFTIADFVADVRAATPSAAAEIVTEGMFAARQEVSRLDARMNREISLALEDLADRIRTTGERLARQHPRRKIEAAMQRLDELTLALQRRSMASLQAREHRLAIARQKLLAVRPDRTFAEFRERLTRHRRSMDRSVEQMLDRLRRRLADNGARLRLLSPQRTLDRGYSITFDEESGTLIGSVKKVSKGQRLRTRLADGDVESVAD